MNARKSAALVTVCAAHAVMAWALMSLGSDRMAYSARTGADDGSRLVTVRLVPVTPPASPAPLAARRPEAEPAPQAAARPVRRNAAGPPGAAAPLPGPADPPAQVATPAPAEPHASTEAALAGAGSAGRTPATPAPQAPPAPRAAAEDTPARTQAPAVVVAQADRWQCPPASHPAALRERGIEGAVLLRVRVDVQGRAADVQLLAGSGWRLFDEAALQQVRACRFMPATQDGQAIDSWVEFPVRFALTG